MKKDKGIVIRIGHRVIVILTSLLFPLLLVLLDRETMHTIYCTAGSTAVCLLEYSFLAQLCIAAMAESGSISDDSSKDNFFYADGRSSNLDDDNNKDTDEGSLRLAQDEQRHVIYSKVFVTMTLIAAATALGLVAFLLTSSEEGDDFRSQVRITDQ